MGKKIKAIYKAGGILIKNRRVLLHKSKRYNYFAAPGGRIEDGESPQRALIRELHEEIGLNLTEADLKPFGRFNATIRETGVPITMEVFLVKRWSGPINPQSEIKEIKWVNSAEAAKTDIASIFAHDVIPLLKRKNLID